MAAASCGGHLCMQMWTSDVPGSEDWTPRAELMSLLEPNDITILILESDHHLLQNDRVHLMRQPYMMLTKLLACLHRQERSAFAFVDALNREKVPCVHVREALNIAQDDSSAHKKTTLSHNYYAAQNRGHSTARPP